MNWLDWVEFILSVIIGVATCIPLVIKLVECAKTLVKEKNWHVVLSELMKYMATAEKLFATGAERKEAVMTMISAFAESVDYDIDLNVISNMIDEICDVSKVVNAEVIEVKED